MPIEFGRMTLFFSVLAPREEQPDFEESLFIEYQIL